MLFTSDYSLIEVFDAPQNSRAGVNTCAQEQSKQWIKSELFVKIAAMHGHGAARQLRPEAAYEFGRFRLDPVQHILWRDDQVLPLGPKVVQTLSILLANCGKVISREELIREVWGNTAVEDSNLAHNISVLRRTLREDPSANYTIEQRCPGGDIGSVNRELPSQKFPRPSRCPRSLIAALPPSKPLPSTRKHWLGVTLALGSLICLTVVGIVLLRMRSQTKLHSRQSVAVVGFANLSQGGLKGPPAPRYRR